MPIEKLFPTLVYKNSVVGHQKMNADLLHDIDILKWDDEAGLRWSEKNYAGGYTSYSSFADLHRRLPSFQKLEKKLNVHMREFVKSLEMDVDPKKIHMTTCWVNVMSALCHHSLHLHPLSFISGTYYVSVPPKSGSFKIEDPRMACFMASPPRNATCSRAQKNFVSFQPREGQVLMFESWLRHEVPANLGSGNRVSVSFNYEWI